MGLKFKKSSFGAVRQSNNISKSSVSNALQISRISLNRKQKSGSKKVSLATKELVAVFYTQMDVSTSFPNKTKSKSSLDVLKDTVTKTFKKVQLAHPDVKIGLSTSRKLKPRHVKKQSQAKMLQCVCDVCENMELFICITACENIELFICNTASMSKNGIEIPQVLQKQHHGVHKRSIGLGLSTLCHKYIHKPKCLERSCDARGADYVGLLLNCWATHDDEVVSYFKWWEHQEWIVKEKSIKG